MKSGFSKSPTIPHGPKGSLDATTIQIPHGDIALKEPPLLGAARDCLVSRAYQRAGSEAGATASSRPRATRPIR